jgi:hypothetical protein
MPTALRWFQPFTSTWLKETAMIITTSIPALVFAMVTSDAIPAEQVSLDRYAGPAIGTVTSAEELRTDTPWLDNDTLLAVAPVPGYLESDEWKRFQQQRKASGADEQKDATA